MLRRLHPDQPASFAFTPANQAWAEAQITKYPEGRQASAIIPLLWRAQEQEGWLTRPAIEHVADMLGLAHIRALEVATFYFMFQLQPVGSVAHLQICGTTSCMICGAEDLVAVCKEKIAQKAHQLSADGKFSWEEVECLGACANAPMAQIGKDYYEDLTAEKLAWIIDEMAAGRVPTPGPQNGRYASEPKGGLTSLKDHEAGRDPLNISARRATDIGDTIKRIDGTEVPMLAPWGKQSGADVAVAERPVKDPRPAKGRPADATGVTEQAAPAKAKARPAPSAASSSATEAAPAAEAEPARLTGPRAGQAADDLKKISGVGPKLEALLNEMGFWHYDQIAAWTPAEVAWVDARLKFKGRIERDGWIAQAAALAAAR
ncbi:NADH-quinone oxidoreductase subunit E [Roseicyclus marinus]|uniref:NADH-quinone oxidoreductase subunit E n=1 Tax=Roseicyclus marinus TaxID=2161673 RepID=UPI00240FD949|nr:NADH-quinone oxidoreductase subunit E [Roseicyclus marinus]MDG3040776.1 NADH-quinone oxidoreductase subunit E [Roseicyclus marinus]